MSPPIQPLSRVKQQLREAFPFDETPQYLIFDNDTIFGAVKTFVESMGIHVKQTAFHCPWQNGAMERVFGSLRRELLDHVVVLNEDHLRRLLKEYFTYYHQDRTHLALGKDAPNGRLEEIPPNAAALVEAQPRVGGLHHRYLWRNAA
ncbi:MAG: transposase [Holophaga sp.]|nr:transposase [Holophaga sp.]